MLTYAPVDADQGVIQKIFYVHVPLAIVALGGFIAGGVMAIMYLRTRDRRWDMRSYVTIHLSIVLAVGVLITGSIWARASWGHWWVWDEPMLVVIVAVGGWVTLSAIRTAPKHSGTNAPAVIANTDA